MGTMKTPTVVRGEEPPMFLQRPSTGKTQDVRHVLAHTFRELFTRDAVSPDTVKNLSVSKGGDDPYHERYVDALQKVFEEWQRRMDEAAMLERHIMQAQARAMSADERELNRVAQSCDNYGNLGLPPGRSHFRSCIDSDLLRKYKLLVPEDYCTEQPSPVPPPQPDKIPSYARETTTSQLHSARMEKMHCSASPQFLAQKSKSDSGFPSFVSEEESDTSSLPDLRESAQFQRNDEWKLQLNEEQRELNRRDLANLQARVNFLRNPRHVPPSAPPGGRTLIKPIKRKPKELGIQPKAEPDKIKEPSVVFLTSPNIVRFTDYKVGQVYEMTLELKNVSAVIRQCRAMPATTPYFNISLGQFPGEHGLVAPGMSCLYIIRFAPDSLRDFDDELRLQTQSSTAVIVPLQGRREPPILTLPPVIDAGYCLVGGCHVVQFIVRNEGGTGRFCMMPKSLWPSANFKSAMSNGGVSLLPFEVRPSVLELHKGESGILEIMFSPTAVKQYTQELTIVCDNCQVHHFTLTGEGQTAGIELVTVERGVAHPLPGELCDFSAQHLIKFDDLNPFTFTDRAIVVKNKSNVQMPFQWMVYKPHIHASEDSDSNKRKYDRVPDVDSVFSVHPPTGVLPSAGEMEFRITFAPPVVNTFHSTVHMLLQQVPPNTQEGSIKSERVRMVKGETRPAAEEDDNISEIIMPSDLTQFRDMTALEIELKGSSIPLNAVLHPYAVHLPGQSLLGTTLKRLVTMANHSRSTIAFSWMPYCEKYILEVEPPFGELDPGMAMDLELSITGVQPGKISHTLYCYVLNLDEPLHLHIEAEFKGPEILIEEPDLNFGLVWLGQKATKEIHLSNLSSIITNWTIQEYVVPEDSENSMDFCEFSFEPSSGQLKPLERGLVTVTLSPEYIGTKNSVFELTVEDGHKSHIAAYVEVQSPTVCLETCEVALDEVFVKVPFVGAATLINQAILVTEFAWGEPEGEHASDCMIELEPKRGYLSSREEKHIAIKFFATREGEFSDIRIPCMIEGMDTPLYMELFCDVKGLSVTYKTSGSLPPFTRKEKPISFDDDSSLSSCDEIEPPRLELDYGENVTIGSTPKICLHICNNSAMTAPYSLCMEYFNAKPPTPPSVTGREGTSQRRALLSRTPNLADPLSKTPQRAHADLSSAMLSQGKGVAFVSNPASGTLSPFGEEIIEVTAFSNMWGDYSDNLICKVGSLDPVSIPVRMTVAGCPLQFQMTSTCPEQSPILRMGTHVSGVAPKTRTMRINNSSPFDVRVDWEVFNVVDDDSKLLDLVVNFGRPFPPRDAQGNEIIPPWETSTGTSDSSNEEEEVPEPPRRYPSDYIPDSPDTSVMGSRKTSESRGLGVELPEESETVVQPKPPKVVSVYLRAHEGVKSTKPFDITPSQTVIPARGHTNISVTFTPPPTEEVASEMDCIGYALGYMSLDKEVPGEEDKVSRLQGYEVSTLRLDMTAHVKPALLTIECADEEGMRYRSAMSDLLQETGQLLPESLRVCHALLSNMTETPLTFRLMVNKPFLLVDLDPSTNSEGATRCEKTDLNTLKPRHNLLVKVAFQTTTDLLGDVPDNCDDNERKTLDEEGELIVEFNNTTSQRVPLYATLSIPQIELSKESLDFGTCLVGQRRALQLTVSNSTLAHSFWTASIESCSDTCVQDTFRVDPVQGLLEAHINYVSNSKGLMTVYFTAKHSEYYEAVFVFHGILGEDPRRLYVRGQGSYDGKHEAILNI